MSIKDGFKGTVSKIVTGVTVATFATIMFSSVANAYVVKGGDTLSGIAQNHNMKLSTLVSMNPDVANINRIYVGEHINTSGVPSTNTNTNNATSTASKVVSTPTVMSNHEQDLLARLVEAEARGESYTGKVAVAEVVLNRVNSGRFPNTIEGVIYQRNQFSPVTNGSINRTASTDSIKATQEALKGTNVTGGALFFYNHTMISRTWQQTLKKTAVIGNHTFSGY